MTTTSGTEPLDGSPGAAPVPGGSSGRPVAVGMRRFSRAEGLLGGLALISFVLVFVRLFEGWRVTPHAVSHHIAILGLRLSYPVANLAAIVVLGFALLGAVVVGITIAGTIREVRASRRFGGRLATARPLAIEDAFVIDDPRPQAFCAGLLRPRVYVTTGAVEILDPEALAAVLLHERHHARRRDPLRLAAGRVLARALFFLPGLAELGRRRQALAEISADLSAIEAAPENRSALARAMLTITDSPEAGESVGIDPDRVDHLLGEPASWRFPAFVFLVALFLLALLAAMALLAGQVAAGSASLAPPFLSAQPCVVVLALIPTGLALVAVAVARSRRDGGASLTSSVD